MPRRWWCILNLSNIFTNNLSLSGWIAMLRGRTHSIRPLQLNSKAKPSATTHFAGSAIRHTSLIRKLASPSLCLSEVIPAALHQSRFGSLLMFSVPFLRKVRTRTNVFEKRCNWNHRPEVEWRQTTNENEADGVSRNCRFWSEVNNSDLRFFFSLTFFLRRDHNDWPRLN